MHVELRYGNGNVPRCPLRDSYCDPDCAWLQRDEEGSCVCSVPLMCMTDVFGMQIMSEVARRGFGCTPRR